MGQPTAEKTYVFCYIVINYMSTCVLAFILATLCMLLILFGFRKYRLISKIGAPKEVRVTYLLVFLWGIGICICIF